MLIDPSQFHLLNVADTCAIWNLLSSVTFYKTSKNIGCNLCCTIFVQYECLYKPRKKSPTTKDLELRERFQVEQEKQIIKSYPISLEDLQSIEILENRKKVSKGELSSIIFAKQTRQAFLSDDFGAIKLARTELDTERVQTTSQLLGFLFFHGHLLDHDKEEIIYEHESFGRGMREHYEKAYIDALKYKLIFQNGIKD